MSHVLRFLEALHESRRRAAERVVRRYGHLVAQAQAYEHRRVVEQAEAEKAALARPASRMVARSAS